MRTILSAMIGIAALSACGTLKTKDYNASAVERVHRAAVIGFQIQRVTSASEALTGGTMGRTERTDAQADQLYDALNSNLTKNLQWSMTDRAALKQRPSYQLAYKGTMDGLQNKMPIPDNQVLLLPAQIMDAEAARLLGLEGRRKLMDDLKVDALIVARVNIELQGFTVAGLGSHYPEAHVSFEVFGRDVEQPIWFDTVVGPASKESVGKTRFFDEVLMLKLGGESARTAFSKIEPENRRKE